MKIQKSSLNSNFEFIDVLNLLPTKRKFEAEISNSCVKIRYLHLGRGGRHSEWVCLPRKIHIDSKIVKAIGIYYGEGDKSRKRWHTRFANSEISVIKHGVELFNSLGINPKQLKGYVKVYNQKLSDKQLVEYWSSKTKIPEDNFFRISKSNSIKPYKRNRQLPSKHGRLEIYFSSVVIRDLVDILIDTIKTASLKNQKFASDFLSGLFAGEGSIKLFKGKVREARIASAFKKEQKYIRKLLESVKIKPSKAEYKFYIAISGIENFRKIKDLDIIHVHPDKNKMFSIGLKNLAPGE